MKDNVITCLVVVVGGALAIVVMLAVVWLGLTFMKPILNAETTNYRQSMGYVEAKITLLEKLMQDYNDLDVKLLETEDQELQEALVAQQLAILRRLITETDKLNPDQVPPSVRRFLITHRGELN